MSANVFTLHDAVDLRQVSTAELLGICLADPENNAGWSELMRRILPKLRIFIRGTLRHVMKRPVALSSIMPGALQASDLLQDTVLRLLESNCALLRRFAGRTEDDLLNYLAAVSRSTVLGCLRRQSAAKRVAGGVPNKGRPPLMRLYPGSGEGLCCATAERQILARELIGLAERALAGFSARDRLVFRLYFLEGLSAAQIARCRGIGLSPAGVKKVLAGIKSRIRALAVRRDARLPNRSGVSASAF